MKVADLQRVLGPLWAALRSTFARAVVRSTSDAPRFQTSQVDLGNGDLRSDVETWQRYGFTSRPLVGAEALVVCPGGERSAAAVIAVDDRRHRPKDLEEGEVAIYTDEGVAIYLSRGRGVRVTGADVEIEASGAVSITAASISLTASGAITLTAAAIDHVQA